MAIKAPWNKGKKSEPETVKVEDTKKEEPTGSDPPPPPNPEPPAQEAADNSPDTEVENVTISPEEAERRFQNDILITNAAIACHEANRAYCALHGDHSQLSWAETPDEIKSSAIEGVKKLLDNPDATPALMHKWWVDYKLAEGWVLGAVKDLNAKTHPCLVDYHDLPAEQKIKDIIFHAVVKGLVGLKAHVDGQ